MTEALKSKLQGDCLPGKHVAPRPGEPPLDPEDVDEGCLHCSTAHIVEFGESVGVVQGLTDYNHCEPGTPEYDSAKVGPEVDVRWEPHNLRYAYLPGDLERAP
jgi:hypothetical protein